MAGSSGGGKILHKPYIVTPDGEGSGTSLGDNWGYGEMGIGISWGMGTPYGHKNGDGGYSKRNGYNALTPNDGRRGATDWDYGFAPSKREV